MRFVLVFAAALILAAACGDGDDSGQPTATVVVGDDGDRRAELTVELARTPGERSRGLSLRDDLAENRGMLFVYPEETESGFWMKDTSIALSIAFIGEGGAILDIQEMEPLSTEMHHPPQPYRYALEVNQGWFRGNGFEVGDRVEIPEAVAAATGE